VSKPVRTTPEANGHILELDAWWRVHRHDAPDLFERELAASFRTVAAAPGLGKRYPHASDAVRRMLMPSTRNHIYYLERDDHVLVVAVWGAIKRAGPDLEQALSKGRT